MVADLGYKRLEKTVVREKMKDTSIFSSLHNIFISKVLDDNRNAETVTHYFFSSPEHEVLRVSYCDCAVSIVHYQLLAHLSTTCSRGAFRVTGCPSSVVRRQQFFKHQLLLNRWANLDQTWQECSLGGPL